MTKMYPRIKEEYFFPVCGWKIRKITYDNDSTMFITDYRNHHIKHLTYKEAREFCEEFPYGQNLD